MYILSSLGRRSLAARKHRKSHACDARPEAIPTHWTVQHSRDKENASLELRPDGSGHLTRGNRCVSGHWRIEKRTKKGEELRLLHFHARDGDGLVYMGTLVGGAVPKGSVWQGTKKVGGFEMRAVDAAPPLPAMSTLSPLPPPLAGVPATARYVPGFVSEADEVLLLEHIRRAGRPWATGHGRRVQNWGGRPGDRGVSEALPEWLRRVVDAAVRSGAWDDAARPPNHALINEYLDPGCGLDPHTDGPLYAPCVAVLALESDVVLELHTPLPAATPPLGAPPPPPPIELLLRRRSLNVLEGDAYMLHHGIAARERDTVGPLVANLQPGDALGEEIVRARRVSIVLVHKLAAHDVVDDAGAAGAAGVVGAAGAAPVWVGVSVTAGDGRAAVRLAPRAATR